MLLEGWATTVAFEKLCAGINSFGFGGTNGHVVVGPGRKAEPNARHSEFPKYFAISAETEPALKALSRKYVAQVAELSEEESASVASAAAYHRDQLSNRIVVSAPGKKAIVEALSAYADDSSHPSLISGEAVGSELPAAFVYSGNGSQWAGMGATAYNYNSTFRARFDEVDRHFMRLAGWSLTDAMMSDALKERLEQTSVAQPLVFAIQCAATAALRQSGLQPSVVIGHSVGEVAASEAAGILDLRTAVDRPVSRVFR